MPDLDNPDVIYVAGDLEDDVVLSEDEAIAILANYGQVRQYLHKKALGRGFHKYPPPGGGRKGKGKGKIHGIRRAITDGSSVPPPPYKKFNTARPKRWTKTSLMDRTKCARCGQRGHWARTCTNPPDERGKRRLGMIGFMSQGSADLTSAFQREDESSPSSAFIFAIFLGPEISDVFVGMVMAPGYALIDTGAQHGVIGSKEYQELCQRLSVQGLKPRSLPTFQATATGVGGSTKFLQTAEVPVAIQGVCGVITVSVIESSLPFLLPISFCRKLGMVLDTNENTATWTKIGGKVSEVLELPSEHIAIDVLEFPPGGWVNPHENPTVLYTRKPDRGVDASQFTISIANKEIKSIFKPPLSPLVPHVGSASMPDSPRDSGLIEYTTSWHKGRGGKLVGVRKACYM